MVEGTLLALVFFRVFHAHTTYGFTTGEALSYWLNTGEMGAIDALEYVFVISMVEF